VHAKKIDQKVICWKCRAGWASGRAGQAVAAEGVAQLHSTCSRINELALALFGARIGHKAMMAIDDQSNTHMGCCVYAIFVLNAELRQSA
jgi:hypothetical protein